MSWFGGLLAVLVGLSLFNLLEGYVMDANTKDYLIKLLILHVSYAFYIIGYTGEFSRGLSLRVIWLTGGKLCCEKLWLVIKADQGC